MLLIELVYLGQKEDVKTLLERGYDINEQDKYGTSAALAAVTRNDINMLKFLIDHGARVDLRDVFGKTPLSKAQEMGSTDIANLIQITLQTQYVVRSSLVIAPSDRGLAKRENWNALFIAIYRGNFEKVKELLREDKESITHRDRLGNDALSLATRYDRKEIAQWLSTQYQKEELPHLDNVQYC